MGYSDVVDVVIDGHKFPVLKHQFWIYYAHAVTTGGDTNVYASQDISACRHFIAAAIDAAGGVGRIEEWVISDKQNPVMHKLVTAMTAVHGSPLHIPNQLGELPLSNPSNSLSGDYQSS